MRRRSGAEARILIPMSTLIALSLVHMGCGEGGRNQSDTTPCTPATPFSYFSDVRNSASEANNLVPFSQFATDLAAHTLPDYSFVVPDNTHNSTDCPSGGSGCSDNDKLAAADNWLKTNIDPLIASADFSTPGGGLLIITFDESAKSDTSQGGGRVAWVIVGPNVKRGFTSSTCFQHESTLRLMSEAIDLTSFPGAAASAPDMREFISGN